MKQAQTDTVRYLAQDTAAAAGLPDLGPLYEPPPVPFTFEPVGWSILAGALLLALLVLAFLRVRQYRRNRYRREALAELERLADRPELLPRLLAVLKRTAIHAFGRDSVARLHGRDWLDFLERTGKEVALVRHEKELSEALYREQPLPAERYRALRAQAMKWIRTHAR